MNVNELVVVNLSETRRRSLIVWRAVPNAQLRWKPDEEALSIGDMIRHIWTAQITYHQIVIAGHSVSDSHTAFDSIPVTDIDQEIAMSIPPFQEFIDHVRELPSAAFDDRKIDRSDVGYIRSTGDFLARIAYHEAVHTGQLLQYLRMAGIVRPQIWD